MSERARDVRRVLMVEDDDALRSLWQHEGPLYYSRELGGVHFTVLRSLHWRAHEVRLSTEQLAWLAQDLAAARLPCIVLLHHPLAPMDLEGNYWFAKTPEICFVAERAEARGIIERSGKVIAVLNGHVHWNHLAVVAGIPYVTFQSLTENVDDDAPGRPARTYAIVDVEAERLAIRVEGEQPVRVRAVVGLPGPARTRATSLPFRSPGSTVRHDAASRLDSARKARLASGHSA